MKTFSYVAKKEEGGEVRGSLKAHDLEEARISLEEKGFSIRKLIEVEGPPSQETAKIPPHHEGPRESAVSGADHHEIEHHPAKAQSAPQQPMKLRVSDAPAAQKTDTPQPMKLRVSDAPAAQKTDTPQPMKLRVSDAPAARKEDTPQPLKLRVSDAPAAHYEVKKADTLGMHQERPAAPETFKFKEEPRPHQEEPHPYQEDIPPLTPPRKAATHGYEPEKHQRRGAHFEEVAHLHHREMTRAHLEKEEAPEKAAPRGSQKGGFLARHMPFSMELVACYRELAAMYGSGITIARGLNLLAVQAQHPLVYEALTSCRDIIEKGGSLSLAFSQNNRVFPPLYGRLLHAAENSGSLQEMLNRIAEHAEKSYKMQMNIRSALAYPIFVLILCLALLIIGPAFTLKGLFDFLKELDVSLPVSTQFLMLASEALRSPVTFIVIAILIFAAVIMGQRIWSSRDARKAIQAFLMRIPAVGDAIVSAEAENFALTLSLLYESGIPLLKAMEYTEKSSNSIILQETIAAARERLFSGCKLQDALKGSRFFPRMALVLLAAGEESGHISDMLRFAGTLFRTKLESALEMFAALMQPIVLLIVGILVGFVVISTMSPMLKVMEGLL
ncbi:MAG: type II secretion system F family protein [Candidatus Eremiobacteraeota bacterium]|nr:type II secretion system F family protein [Candidatus Eremiobacteraeota bacterium]